jgi:cytochrome c biogenesis protein CcmG/thiol:disulfide interchange protein DsbE
LLIQDVVANYQGRVRFVSENWGTSKLAERYGVKKYPVVFVNEVLFAQPNDFGWFGAKGKYTPWREAANHDRFKSDLAKMIEIVLANPKAGAAKARITKVNDSEIASLPGIKITDVNGKPLASTDLAGRIVVVEFWATWCPPCLQTLEWLGKIKKQYGENLAIVAIAVESPEADVRKLISSMNLPFQFALGSEPLVEQFGSLNSVPKMFVFDKTGKTAAVFYGATADLHSKISRVLNELVKG